MTKSGRATIAGYIAAYRAKGADTRELQRGQRFIELRIGELLGPAEQGGDRTQQVTGQSPALPKERAYEFRRLAAHRVLVIAQVRAGVLGRQALLAPSALTRDQGSLPCHTALSPPTGGTRR